MAITKVEEKFNFAVCAALVVSCLQLLATVKAKPLPNATSWENHTLPEDSCQCNSTNLTMMVDGNFLYKWRASFDSHHHRHSIRHLSEAAGNLTKDTEGVEASSYK